MTVQCCRTIDHNVVCKFIIIIIILDTSNIGEMSNRTWELGCKNTFTILFSDSHSFLFFLFNDLSKIRKRTPGGSPNISYNNFIASLFGRLPNEIQRSSSWWLKLANLHYETQDEFEWLESLSIHNKRKQASRRMLIVL